ncbi:MAG: Coenzyme F420 hydrogenase/dehydrogenase, beta subunit C-terminal domain [Muribaculum sp.]|nr:Coenzyme F420 hydrogenase/dehydrogenase, beta subunit C-terminal domain [Muribaculum sp.]
MVEYSPLGALYPKIDQSKCIDCGLCAKTCPNNSVVEFYTPQKVYAAWSLDNSDRDSSTSGGLGSVLTSFFIENGGAVYGAVVRSGVVVEHARATTMEEAQLFKKSKYVQSHISPEIIKSIKIDLKNGLHVLFTGTPCQIAGVRNATHSHPNLTTVDIICHGVPPLHILHEHIKMTGNDIESIDSFSTRDTDGYILSLIKNGNIVYRKPLSDDAYLYGFQYSLFLRDNCYACKYTRPERQSDITIGDFWGLGETSYPHKKVSAVMVNTGKGAELIANVKSRLYLDERTLTEAVNGNPQLNRPSISHPLHKFFVKNVSKLGYPLTINLSLLKFRITYPVFKLLMKNKYFRRYYSNSKK